MSQRFRILLYNVGYATALDGSLRSYLLHFYRYIYTPRYIIRRVRQMIYSILQEQQPDVCCFVEIHRKKSCVPHPHAYAQFDVENKYGQSSVLRRLPFFRDNCNGFYAKNTLDFQKIFLKHGTKKLIYEIKLRPDTSLFLVHFSLEKRVRAKQCEELKEIVQSRENAIVCGDFNIFKGTGELESLAQDCGLRIVNTPGEATFPAVNPKRALDLFLCPEHVQFAEVKVLSDCKGSDHLPVMLELELAGANN
jgi:exonuclease III